jgi:hypothetical protein
LIENAVKSGAEGKSFLSGKGDMTVLRGRDRYPKKGQLMKE